MLDTSRQKELALAAVWITFLLAGVTDSIAILAAGRHSQVPLRLLVIFTSLSTSYHTARNTHTLLTSSIFLVLQPYPVVRTRLRCLLLSILLVVHSGCMVCV